MTLGFGRLGLYQSEHRVSFFKVGEWKRQHVHDLIQLSILCIPLNVPLMLIVLSFWGTSTSSFHFPCGMMSLTLLDLSALLGVRPDGNSISALFLEENLLISPLTLGFEKNLSY